MHATTPAGQNNKPYSAAHPEMLQACCFSKVPPLKHENRAVFSRAAPLEMDVGLKHLACKGYTSRQ